MNLTALTIGLVFIVFIMGGLLGMILLSLLVMAKRQEDSVEGWELKNRKYLPKRPLHALSSEVKGDSSGSLPHSLSPSLEGERAGRNILSD
ncbi:MAG: hypothetical protein FJ126_05300 [Deltaproteobacteria bacterium]|nr:hypothetical protein [Deltaproteobacteria bacterium]